LGPPGSQVRNEGVGAIDEGGTIPIAGQQGWVDFIDTLRHNLGSIEITRYAIRLSRRKPGAFVRLLETETEGLVKDLRKDINRQAFGAQTGALAAVTADGANTVTVDSVQYLRVGMRIDLIDSTNDTVLASEPYHLGDQPRPRLLRTPVLTRRLRLTTVSAVRVTGSVRSMVSVISSVLQVRFTTWTLPLLVTSGGAL
jgi:hypothetical protein